MLGSSTEEFDEVPQRSIAEVAIEEFDLVASSEKWKIAADWLQDKGSIENYILGEAFRDGIYVPLAVDGDGDGDGYGDGYGHGYGYGNGNGNGDGNGNGHGHGNGYGNGNGDGDGNGNGDGHGHGYG